MTPYAVLEEQARAVLPQPVFDYYAGGAGDEETLAANTRAWSAVRLRPRVLRAVSRVDNSTTVLDTRVALAGDPRAYLSQAPHDRMESQGSRVRRHAEPAL